MQCCISEYNVLAWYNNVQTLKGMCGDEIAENNYNCYV